MVILRFYVDFGPDLCPLGVRLGFQLSTELTEPNVLFDKKGLTAGETKTKQRTGSATVQQATGNSGSTVWQQLGSNGATPAT